jgi:hypothetical protein
MPTSRIYILANVLAIANIAALLKEKKSAEEIILL